MKIERIHIKNRYKNLNDFIFDFEREKWEMVLIGVNASGKSNFIEAIFIIFRDLDLECPPINKETGKVLEYNIKYNCRGVDIEIDYSSSNGYSFIIDGAKKISKNHFFKNKDKYLPSHVFTYYSGLSDRLINLYKDHKKHQFEKMMNRSLKYEDFNEIPRIFLVESIHASFAIIALFLFPDKEGDSLQFLKEHLKISGFGSALFKLKQPRWSKSRKEEDVFWNTSGLVRRFIEDLWSFSTAPIFYQEQVSTILNRKETLNRLFLFMKDQKAFDDLMDVKMFYGKNTVFNALCSLHFSELVEDKDVKMKVEKEGINGELSMEELSEGEKQLITVFGLLKFTKDEEALILLDEPDTHLNPLWKWKYHDFLKKVVKDEDKTQVVFCTHDPLVIGNLEKSELKIFSKNEKGDAEIRIPKIDPYEMSVAKILTSELFGIPSIMSKYLEDKLNRKRFLQTRILKEIITKKELEEYNELKSFLDERGFYETSIDSRYNRFLSLTSENEKFSTTNYSDKDLKELDRISKEVMDKIIEEETNQNKP